MRKIVYIHGFASNGNSFKGKLLKDIYGNIVITPNLKSKPKEDIDYLENIIIAEKNPLIIGSSLGGFYGEYLSKKYNLDALLINPIADIYDAKVLIGTHEYFFNNEKFNFSEEDYKYLLSVKDEIFNMKIGSEKRIILASKDDDVLDYRKSLNYFIEKNETVKIYNYGGHSFNEEKEIQEVLETIF